MISSIVANGNKSNDDVDMALVPVNAATSNLKIEHVDPGCWVRRMCNRMIPNRYGYLLKEPLRLTYTVIWDYLGTESRAFAHLVHQSCLSTGSLIFFNTSR